MAKVELKQPVVEEISAGIKDAQSVVLVDYRGLTVEQDTQLRKSLREAGVSYKVYKNTMMNFAFKGTQFEGLSEYLEGPSAMAYSTEDATAPARVLAQFAKTADKLEMVLFMMLRVWLQSLTSLPETYSFPNCLAAYRVLSPILHVL